MDGFAEAKGILADGLTVQHSDDRILNVTFYERAVQNNFQTTAKGYPVFDPVVFCRILTPGNTSSIWDQPARDIDKQRFPRHWAHFENKTTHMESGLPVDQWSVISLTTAATLKALNIHTVETLAQVSDANVFKIGTGGTELREKAKAFVASHKEPDLAQKLAVDLQHQKEDNEALRTQMAEMSARVAAMEQAKPTGKRA